MSTAAFEALLQEAERVVVEEPPAYLWERVLEGLEVARIWEPVM